MQIIITKRAIIPSSSSSFIEIISRGIIGNTSSLLYYISHTPSNDYFVVLAQREDKMLEIKEVYAL